MLHYYPLVILRLKKQLGLMLKSWRNTFKGKKEGDKDYEHAHEYDMYFAFKKVIKKLADVLEKNCRRIYYCLFSR